MNNKSSNQGFGVTAVIVAFGLLAVLLAVGWYVRQGNNDKPAETSMTNVEQGTDQSEDSQVEAAKPKTGTFTGVAPKTGSGSVTLTQDDNQMYTVQLADNFKVQDGPALYVGFGNNGTVDQSTLFTELKAFDGRQDYQVPSTIDVSKYSQVIIYCKEFTVTFSVATLE